jgi:alpha-galactosidase
MTTSFLRPFLFVLLCGLPALAQNAPAPAAPSPQALSLDTWKTAPPFSFTYGGKPSAGLLSTWTRSEETSPSEGGELHRITWIDPATQLKVIAEARAFADFPAMDWVVTFTNGGTADTPILEQIEAMDWTRPCTARDPVYQRWYGGNGNAEDFNPGEQAFDPNQPTKFGNAGGRSSRITLPYFNYLDATYNGSGLTYGPGGAMVAIGWAGNWDATLHYDPNAKTLRFVSGMPKTHLLLHPGESIRTPRMVVLSWTGDKIDATNQWRQFVLRYYAPHGADGKALALPVTYAGGGGTSDARVAQIAKFNDAKVSFNLYGLAGWAKQRGTWTPDPANFPNGFEPLTDAARAAGMGIMLHMEPELADPGSELLTQHADWFFPPQTEIQMPPLLDLGNPAARKGITALASQLITDSGATYFHHEIMADHLDAVWGAADKPDRIGMTEINYITGLYAFWDDLQKQHPGLLIDQPEWRLDIESMRRGAALWRVTYGKDMCNQMQISQLSPWVPLNAGLLYSIPPDTTPGPVANLYELRSSYGAAWTIGAPLPVDNTLAQALAEYRRAQPLALGDFYLLNMWDSSPNSGLAWQWHRPDLKAGVVLALRRQNCLYTAVQPMLRAIDPAATYEVEVKLGLEPGTVSKMSGADLAHIQISLPDKPSSALVFYKQAP